MLKQEQYLSNIPDFTHKNFRVYLDDIASRYTDREALRMKFGEDTAYTTWTFKQVKQEADTIARYFYSSGFKQGDKIGILSENRPEWGITYLGIVSSGLVAVPIDAMLEAETVASIVDHSDCKALFYSEKQQEKLQLVKKKCGDLSIFINFDTSAGDEPHYSQIVSGTWKAQLPTADDLAPESMASIIYTSGTTGEPKGVMLSHRGIIANVSASIISLPIYASDVFILVLPLHHTYPTTCSFLSPLIVGGSVTIAEKLVGKKIIANIRETGGSVLIGVPLLFDKIKQSMQSRLKEQPLPTRIMLGVFTALSRFFLRTLGLPAGKLLFRSLREKAGLASLRLMVSGGGPLNSDTADFFDTLGFSIVQGYGMSENGPLIATNTVDYKNNSSVGLPVKYTDIKTIEPDQQGVGEIVVRSPSLMLGYYKNEQATRESFTEDGYLRTGDLGYFDKKGFLFIAGRRKNLIVTSGGKNIYPEEIEYKFGDSTAIKEIIIVGKQESEKSRGEDVVAVCVPDYEYLQELYPDREITREFAEELIGKEISEVNKTLPGYKKIQEYIIRDEGFEKTSSQKIKRYLYKDRLGDIRADVRLEESEKQEP
jgi:long-chain acyl-CoA synthetase